MPLPKVFAILGSPESCEVTLLADIELTNFKAFAETQHIRIRPITLIYGANSSGKSSILQSLLLLKQTIGEGESSGLLLSPKGSLVDLGGYKELVHHHDTGRPLKIKLNAALPKGVDTPRGRYYRRLVGAVPGIEQTALQFDFGYDESTSNAVLAKFLLFLGNDRTPVAEFRRVESPEPVSSVRSQMVSRRYSALARSGTESTFRVDECNFEHEYWQRYTTLLRRKGESEIEQIQRELTSINRDLEQMRSLEQISSDEEANATREELSKQLRARLQSLEAIERSFHDLLSDDFRKVSAYLTRQLKATSVRSRSFLPTEVARMRGGSRGSSYDPPAWSSELSSIDLSNVLLLTADALREELETIVYLGPLRQEPGRHYIFGGSIPQNVGKSGRFIPDTLFRNSQLLDQVNVQFAKFGINYELKIVRSNELSEVYALRLVDQTNLIEASIADVGFGISQVLPVIAQSLLSHQQTVCIEQPEIHLHPKLQAELGSLFAECIQEPFSNSFIIETHSEHLMLRIQRLVRQRKLAPGDVSIIFVDASASAARCIPLRIDEEGDFIDRWPDGFFEEGFKEIFSGC